MKWQNLEGDERRRFCAQCGLHVVNLSLHTEAERRAVLAEHQGRLCVSYYRRLTGEPVAVDRPLPSWLRRHATPVALAAAMPMLLAACATQTTTPSTSPVSTPRAKQGARTPDEETVVLGVLGMVCDFTPTPPPPPHGGPRSK